MTGATDGLYIQASQLIAQLGWTWDEPRIKAWINRAGFSHHFQLTPKAKHSLLKYLVEVNLISGLLLERNLDWEWLTRFFISQGYAGGIAPLKGWIKARQQLEQLAIQIPF